MAPEATAFVHIVISIAAGIAFMIVLAGGSIMFVTVVAVMCHLMVAKPTLAADTECTAEEAKVEEIVTDSSMDDRVTFHSCMIHHQIGVAEWKSKHPIYLKAGWRVARVKCAPGHYAPKNAV